MQTPFLDKLRPSRNVLIAGAGGGFDIFAGLPIYTWLRQAGKTVHLANLSFTELDCCEGVRPVRSLLRVLPDTSGPTHYFPELYLSQWLTERFGSTPVYAIHRGGVQEVLAAYKWLVAELQPDTLILVDGGTDSLLRGDEAGLGTPQEDMASLGAADAVTGVDRKFLVCIGFGIDTFHGVCHAQFLENVAGLIQEGGFLGAWSLDRETAEFQAYEDASSFVLNRMPNHPSIVNTSIISATNGHFGNHHATRRTEGSTLFINPLMSLYWSFELGHVAQRNLYLKEIRDTANYFDLALAIERFRARLPETRPWMDIPC